LGLVAGRLRTKAYNGTHVYPSTEACESLLARAREFCKEQGITFVASTQFLFTEAPEMPTMLTLIITWEATDEKLKEE
jgi:hypothetical protein